MPCTVGTGDIVQISNHKHVICDHAGISYRVSHVHVHVIALPRTARLRLHVDRAFGQKGVGCFPTGSCISFPGGENELNQAAG